MSSEHPVHPATVHFPLAFLTLSYGLDIYHAIAPNLPSSLTNLLPSATELTRGSYYLLSLGLLSSIPAVMSGGQQAFMMISKQGLYDTSTSGKKVIKPKVQTTIAHALANDVVLAISAYSWWVRRQNAAASMAGKVGIPTGAAAYAPETWMVGVSAVLAVGLVFAANLGGTLVYNYGVGFRAVKSSVTGKKSQ
ncbi:hypothetical protein K402DRAFT_461748 [Aulographum hederae CBS 113979]|uniref:DUF2231 domain-containing protein n=1 Tax=Aulographum hederae CBS 113979 TaxID=1176131 RepID=A0A6G1H6Z7_9PEZI|nr:hypothetical protein K402DRAFT_461748 [Aulographum hederae CBS 113979]